MNQTHICVINFPTLCLLIIQEGSTSTEGNQGEFTMYACNQKLLPESLGWGGNCVSKIQFSWGF